jgi:hypothetical protein
MASQDFSLPIDLDGNEMIISDAEASVRSGPATSDASARSSSTTVPSASPSTPALFGLQILLAEIKASSARADKGKIQMRQFVSDEISSIPVSCAECSSQVQRLATSGAEQQTALHEVLSQFVTSKAAQDA